MPQKAQRAKLRVLFPPRHRYNLQGSTLVAFGTARANGNLQEAKLYWGATGSNDYYTGTRVKHGRKWVVIFRGVEESAHTLVFTWKRPDNALVTGQVPVDIRVGARQEVAAVAITYPPADDTEISAGNFVAWGTVDPSGANFDGENLTFAHQANPDLDRYGNDWVLSYGELDAGPGDLGNFSVTFGGTTVSVQDLKIAGEPGDPNEIDLGTFP